MIVHKVYMLNNMPRTKQKGINHPREYKIIDLQAIYANTFSQQHRVVSACAHTCIRKTERNEAYLETLGQKLEGSLLHDQHAPRS